MSRKSLNEAVIRHLQQSGYKFQRVLGRGGFADVIAVLTPNNEEQAVKIVEKKKMWDIEDQYWPTLRHPHLLPVNNVMEIEELDVKLYFMPVLPNTLFDMVESKNFRQDPNSFKRVKKWLLQVLSALEYLHNSGFSHLDLKTDNVLIDSDDNAVLADFSGLNFTKFPINRPISPIAFRSPECFTTEGCTNIRGQFFDMWTFSILALNALTAHYYNVKSYGVDGENVHWWTQLRPLLKKALTESKFEKLMRKAFPKANLSKRDVNQSLHFIKFVMKIRPDLRPSAIRAKQHLFLKTISNPFVNDCHEVLQNICRGINPFKKGHDGIDPYGQGDAFISKTEKVTNSYESPQDKGIPKRRNIGHNVRKWFVRNINRVFK